MVLLGFEMGWKVDKSKAKAALFQSPGSFICPKRPVVLPGPLYYNNEIPERRLRDGPGKNQ